MSSAEAPNPPTTTEPRQPSRTVPALVTLVALLLGVIAAFLAWFVFSGTNVALVPSSYNSMYLYVTQGKGALQTSNALGAALVASSTSDPVILAAFSLVLFFWPAMLVSGLYNAIARSFAPYPFVWGLITFISAYVLVYKASATLGLGAWLVLAASFVFLAASILGRFVKPKPTSAVATVGSTTPGNSTTPAGSPPTTP